MAGRNDHIIADALEPVAQALHGQHNQAGGEFHDVGKFQRNKLPTFKGKYDLEGTHMWLREIEKSFRLITCTKEQNVLFGTHILSEEVEA